MSDKTKITVETASKGAPIWFIGWMFTIGFADLSFWQGVQAIVIWPYYIGTVVVKLFAQ
ncbi:MAG: hypothetical protein OEZ34_01280 [Spirochaetia bacterium]|nr:hypothetical protein [Spirochaetia bacterium]